MAGMQEQMKGRVRSYGEQEGKRDKVRGGAHVPRPRKGFIDSTMGRPFMETT